MERVRPAPRLSICIPTYNRAACLAELLDSIVAQQAPDVEVVVSDDGSSDATALVGEAYRSRLPNYRFIRQPANLGNDGNFVAVIEAASGDYVWLVGDDDRLEPGGIRRVLEALERWPGVAGLTLGVIDYDFAMERPIGMRPMPRTGRLEGVRTVFGQAAEHLSFMSSLVIDRQKWRTVAADPSLQAFQKYYLHLGIIAGVIKRYVSWGVINEPCVGFRSANDQFLSALGWLDRLKIDVLAYEQVASAYFGDDPRGRTAMLRRVFDVHVMAHLLNAKAAEQRAGGVAEAALFLLKRYAGDPAYWTTALPTLLAPQWLVRRARAAYRRHAKTSRAALARRFKERQLA